MPDAESPEPAADSGLTAAVHAAQQGDTEAFRVVYRAVQPGLLRYLRVLVGHDAEDVASDAWAQIVRDMARFHGDGNGFRGWVVTIGRHRAIDHLRRVQRQPATDPVEGLADLPGAEDTAESALEAVSTDAALALIAALPREQAEAVLLRVVLGLDARTAARVLGKRPGAVRTAAHRGLRRLSAGLPPPADTPPDPAPDGRATAPRPRAGRVAPPAEVTLSAPTTLRRSG